MITTYLIFFISGAILNSIFSRVLGIVKASLAFHDLEREILKLLLALEGDMSAALAAKNQALLDAGADPKQIQENLEIDEQLLQSWREVVLNKMILSCPKSFWRLIRYESWAEARLYAMSLQKEE